MSVHRKAIILAAGVGSRLGSYSANLPKTLLEIGDLTIFDRIIIGLDKIGIKDVVVISGYEAARLQSHANFSRHLTNNRISLEFIENNNLNIGNIYSFWLARNEMDEDILLVNSDVVFHYRVLEFLRDDPHDSALLVDDFKTLGAEEMKVKTDGRSVIKEITKEMNPATASGEYIGIMKVSRKTAEKVTRHVEDLLNQGKYPMYYEDAFRLLAEQEDSLFACSTQGLPWTEVDTVEDMKYARSIILPQIQARV